MSPKGKSKKKQQRTKSDGPSKLITFRLNPERYENLLKLRAFYTQKWRDENILEKDEELSNSAMGRLAFDFLYEYTLIQINKGNDGTRESRLPIINENFTFLKDLPPSLEKMSDEGKAELKSILGRDKDNGGRSAFVEVGEDSVEWGEWEDEGRIKKPTKVEVKP